MASTMTAFNALSTLPRRILARDQEMIVWWSMKAGAHAAAHARPHEQIFFAPPREDFRPGAGKPAYMDRE